MWFFDKHGNAINSAQIMGLYVMPNPDSAGYYVVGANAANSTLIAEFALSATMSESDATALYTRMTTMLGVVDLTQ